MPVFVRGGDLISIQPMVWGEYEPEVVELIKYWADLNYSDFFLDIGANIGLFHVKLDICLSSFICLNPIQTA